MYIEIILFLIAIFAYFYLKVKQKCNAFKQMNIEYDTPVIGFFKHVILRKRNMYDQIQIKYKSFNSSVVGMFEFLVPVFMIRHPDLVNQILVSDFSHFTNHIDHFSNEYNGVMANTLIGMQDQKWKDMRATLTPAYTGSKLRSMFEFMRETAEQFTENMKNEIRNGLEDVEVKDYFLRYALDVIATTAFGFRTNSMVEKDNRFFKMAKGIINFGKFGVIKFIIIMMSRRLSKLLKLRMISKKYTDYYEKFILGEIENRCKNKIYRPDIINLLMEARGQAVDEKCEQKVKQNWSDIEIVAQQLMFLFSGFETISAVLCFLTHELMENQEVQAKLKKEIQEVLENLNGDQLTYEVLNEMKYLDCVVSEVLRKWPINSMTDRVCNKSIEIQDPETGENIKLNPGDKVIIPIVGLQRDSKYYPNPMQFDPERFNEENKLNLVPNTYLPFGVGPRMCIAHRFAFMEIKVLVFYMFSGLSVNLSEKSSVPLELDPSAPQPYPKNGFWVKISEDNKN